MTSTSAGVDAAREPRRAREVVGYCPDVGGLIPRATPVGAPAARGPAARHAAPAGRNGPRDLLDRFDLAGAADRVTSGFSHGMGRRLSVLLAAFHEPAVLLLDEPFDGVDPLGVEATLEEVRRARMRGAAVLVSTHLLELAVQACDEAVVLRAGRVVAALAVGRAGRGGRGRALPRAAHVSRRGAGADRSARCSPCAGAWCARAGCASG